MAHGRAVWRARSHCHEVDPPFRSAQHRRRARRAGYGRARRRHAAAQAQRDRKWKHGLSLFGEPKYPADFKHFDYVNPTAPQGGTVRQIAFGTFDNFNQVVAGVKGSLAQGIELFTDTLMRRRSTRCRPNTACSRKRSAIRTIFPRSPIGCAPMRTGTTASR